MLCSYHEKGKQDSTYQGWSTASGRFAHWRIVGTFFILGLWKMAKLIFAPRPDKFCNEESESLQICALQLPLGVMHFWSENVMKLIH